MRIETVDVERIRALRHKVLRAGMPIETTYFTGDELATHYAALIDGAVVGCVSALVAPFPEHDEPADRQLRGMATDPVHRGRGIGGTLVRTLLADAPGRVWCNARIAAANVYRRAGFEQIGEPFEVPIFGTHLRMLNVNA
ncbi:MAG: GNAT family N-acetyltransferase [Planctomycetota bacterium]